MANASLDDSHQAGTYRRIELITGDAKRRIWTAEEKAQILAESFRPGAKVSDVARRHGMNRGLLWTWRHQARKRGLGGEQTFVPVRIVEESAAPPAVTVGPCAVSARGRGWHSARRRRSNRNSWIDKVRWCRTFNASASANQNDERNSMPCAASMLTDWTTDGSAFG